MSSHIHLVFRLDSRLIQCTVQEVISLSLSLGSVRHCNLLTAGHLLMKSVFFILLNVLGEHLPQTGILVGGGRDSDSLLVGGGRSVCPCSIPAAMALEKPCLSTTKWRCTTHSVTCVADIRAHIDLRGHV